MMKKTLLMAFVGLLLMSCETKQNETSVADNNSMSGNQVEVIYFHGKQRCATCRAIEQLTHEVVNEEFSQELSDGTLAFRVVDLSLSENKALAEQYEVTWSSLFVVKGEQRENLTDLAFGCARSDPERFKQELHNSIEQALR